MFKKYKYDINLVTEPFENLRYRDRTVLILCRDAQGKFILGAKHGYYPQGIVRMLGGGVDNGENVVDAAIRETEEEIGIKADPSELTELAEIEVTGTYKNKTYKTKMFVYFLNSDKDDYLAGDDVSEVVRYAEQEYRNLIKRFFELKPDDIYKSSTKEFSWGDFGKVYGFVHQVTLEELLARKI
ncbi:MAG TPA: NUDIX hydrolase [Patescibacteria group bacterium]|nr:NUDIX hydrolase [Patescibacteria group bacterium]